MFTAIAKFLLALSPVLAPLTVTVLHLLATLWRPALSLRRGYPLADAHSHFVEQERDRLEQMRLGALEERISLDLELGRADGVVAELIGSINDHPLRCTYINRSRRYSATNCASNRAPAATCTRSVCVRHPSFRHRRGTPMSHNDYEELAKSIVRQPDTTR